MKDDSSIGIESSGNVYSYCDDEDASEEISLRHWDWRNKSQHKKKRMLAEFYAIMDTRRNGQHAFPAPIRMAIDHALGPLLETFMERVHDEIKNGIFNKRVLSTDRLSVQQVETMVRSFPDVIDGNTWGSSVGIYGESTYQFTIMGALKGENGLGVPSKRRAIQSIPFVPVLVGLARELKIKPYSKITPYYYSEKERWGLLAATDGSDGINALQLLAEYNPITEWDDEGNGFDDDIDYEAYDDIDDVFDKNRDYNAESNQVKLDALKQLRRSKLFLKSDVRKYDLVHYTCREPPTLLAVTKSNVLESVRDQCLELVKHWEWKNITEEDFRELHADVLEEECTSMTEMIAEECFSKKRFKFLVDFDPTSLGSKTSKKFDGRLPLHMCVHSNKIFHIVFEEGMNRYPQNLGFLFYKDNSNTTPYELACKKWGTGLIGDIRNKMWNELKVARKKLELGELANGDDDKEKVKCKTKGKILPKGWTQYLDPKSGVYYYYHAKDGTTSWERPTTSRRNSPLSTENLIVSAASNCNVSLDCVYLLIQQDPSVVTPVAARLLSLLPSPPTKQKMEMYTTVTNKRKSTASTGMEENRRKKTTASSKEPNIIKVDAAAEGEAASTYHERTDRKKKERAA